MTAPMSRQPKRLEVTLSVTTEGQVEELHAAWLEIVSGKRPRLDTAAEELNGIMERAMVGLQKIVKAIEEHPGTEQTGERVYRLLELRSTGQGGGAQASSRRRAADAAVHC